VHGRRLIIPAVGTLALFLSATSAASTSTTVCNEAENSHRGGYVLTEGPVDPAPPAFLRGSPMNVGGGKGVANAALHSPALRVCETTPPPPPPTDGGGTGGTTGGTGDTGGGGTTVPPLPGDGSGGVT